MRRCSLMRRLPPALLGAKLLAVSAGSVAGQGRDFRSGMRTGIGYTAAFPDVQAGVGAVFDFLSGNKPQAPRWIATLGLEWLFRLCTEPRRLFWRYLTNNPAFVWRVLLQGLGRRPKAL